MKLSTTIQPKVTKRTDKCTTSNVHVMKFGNGYTQRTSTGPIVVKLTLDLEWEGSLSEINKIYDFLSAREDNESFEWTQPEQQAELTWVCQKWSIATSEGSPNGAVTAVFEQQ